MCTVSMVGDHYRDIFEKKPWWPGELTPAAPTMQPITWPAQIAVSRDEFEELKRQVEEMKALLARAKEYDERNNEPDCEIEEKMEILRAVAKLVGVDLTDVIGKGRSDG